MNGLAMGCIYALIAMGFLLIFNACRAANFAQGDLAMLGGFMGYAAVGQLGLPPWSAYVAPIVGMALFGYALQFVAYKPLQGKPFVSVIVSTLAVGLILRYGTQLVWGPLPESIPSLLSISSFTLLGVSLDSQVLVIIAATAVLLALLYVLFEHTHLGTQLRATSQDSTAAQLMGIPVGRMIAISFVFSAAVTGLAGALVGPELIITNDMGVGIGLRAFVAVVIGGMGSIPGAVLGGLLIGVLDQVSAAYISAGYKDAIAFGFLVLVLFIRPQGIFGEKISEKV